LALLKSLADELNLRGIVDTLLPWEGPRGSASHGEVVEALVLNRLYSPRPLYLFDHWMGLSGLADLYGLPADRFHDDRLRETLDAIAGLDERIQDAVAFCTVSHFGVPADRVLYDISSLYFEGDYSESELIEFGYSRDHMPHKKQVNVGLTVSETGGVPLNSRVLRGSTSDVVTVEENAKALQRITGRKDLLIISDGGMLCPANVTKLENQGVKFIAPWNGDSAILKALTEHGDRWSWDTAPYRGSTGDETYATTELGVCVTYDEVLTDESAVQTGKRGRPLKHPHRQHTHWLRAILVRASGKQSRDEKKTTKHLAAIEEKLTKLQTGLNQRRLKDRAGVEAELARLFEGENQPYRKCFDWTLSGGDEVLPIELQAKRRGRPKTKSERTPMIFKWEQDTAEVERIRQTEGIYVLLTNLRDPEQYPPAEILRLYKRRNPVEDRFRTLKNTVKVRPLFVHTDERVRALVLVTILALTVYSLIEWRARQAEEVWTASQLIREFEGITLLQTHRPDKSVELEWCNLMPHHESILRRLLLRLPDLPDYLYPSTSG
jgi:transposase